MTSNMRKHIESNQIFTNSKHGFRRHFSTVTQLVLHVAHNPAKALDRKIPHHLVSFDFTKAFDKVPHDLLVYKLKKYRFSSQICAWVEEWLRGRVSVVKVNGWSLRSLVCHRGYRRALCYGRSFSWSTSVIYQTKLGSLTVDCMLMTLFFA